MAKMKPDRASATRADISNALRRDNKNAREADLQMYAAAFIEFRDAQKNISENGIAVLHPRTGAPIPNPCIPGRDSASKLLRDKRFNVLKTDAVWRDFGFEP